MRAALAILALLALAPAAAAAPNVEIRRTTITARPVGAPPQTAHLAGIRI